MIKKKNKTNDLLKEAIADAQRIKQTALENAKMVIEESLSPKIKKILSEKLNEMADDDLDEGMYDSDEDLDIDEILRELEEDDLNENEDLDEAAGDDEDKPKPKAKPKTDDKPKPKPKAKPKSEDDDDDDEDDDEGFGDDDDDDLGVEDDMSDGDGDLGGEEQDVKDMSASELSELITSIIQGVMGTGEEDGLGGSDIGPIGAEDGLDSGRDDIGFGDDMEGEEDDIDISEDEYGIEEDEDDMVYESLKQINKLREELKETNLLNSKLLYMNKVFAGQQLNEQEKIGVMKAFDKADSVKEAKLIFETIQTRPKRKETANSRNRKTKYRSTAGKRQIREVKGSASSVLGGSMRKPIVKVNETVARWQKLAGLDTSK